MTKLEQAARQALGALEVATTPLAKDRQEVLRAIAALREALRGAQALSAGPAGWKLVPEDATEEMVRATDKVNFANADTDGTMHNVWNVMLAASPQPPVEQAAPKAAPAPLSEMPYEKRKAIQEGEQISASDAWFHARFNMLDTLDRRNVFRAGFDRGWNAALVAQGGAA